MNTFIRTPEFDDWLRGLNNAEGRIRILTRIISAGEGNFGDCRAVGGGISEMRIFAGPGYRLYYTRRGKMVYLLICGGDKSSQKRDIQLAKSILNEIEQGETT